MMRRQEGTNPMPCKEARLDLRECLTHLSTHRLQISLVLARRDTENLTHEVLYSRKKPKDVEGAYAFSFVERGRYKAALKMRGAPIPPLSATWV